MIRLGYGPDEIYTRFAQRSLDLWKQLFAEIGPHAVSLFQNTGILWLARDHDPYCEAILSTLQTVGARFEKLDEDEIVRRWALMGSGQTVWGILEPDSGVLMARRAVQALVARAREIGVDYVKALFTPQTRIDADRSVFACGPWLPKLFPELLGELIHVTRQEVFFLVRPRAANVPAHTRCRPGSISTTWFTEFRISKDAGSSWLLTNMDRSSIPILASALCRKKAWLPRGHILRGECRCLQERRCWKRACASMKTPRMATFSSTGIPSSRTCGSLVGDRGTASNMDQQSASMWRRCSPAPGLPSRVSVLLRSSEFKAGRSIR